MLHHSNHTEKTSPFICSNPFIWYSVFLCHSKKTKTKLDEIVKAIAKLSLSLHLNVISFMKRVCAQPLAPGGYRKNCTTLT